MAAAPRHPYYVEAGRGGTCAFVNFEGSGDERAALFRIAPSDPRPVESVQTWLFYYDAAGKQLARYPHATAPHPGAQALGHEGAEIPAGTAAIECELTRISFVDGTAWFNANLLRNDAPRPRGGYDAAELATHTGERVRVDVLDAKTGKVRLTNLGDRPIASLDVDVIFFHADGEHQYETELGVAGPIAPGKSVERTVELLDIEPFERAEGTAPSVKYADGTRWFNRNLSGFELP